MISAVLLQSISQHKTAVINTCKLCCKISSLH